MSGRGDIRATPVIVGGIVLAVAGIVGAAWILSRMTVRSAPEPQPNATAPPQAEVAQAKRAEPVAAVRKPLPERKPDAAIAAVQKIFADENLQYLLAAMALGKDEAAGDALLRLEAREAPAGSDHDAARKLNARGLALLRAADTAGATQAFSDAARTYPADAEIVNNLAYAYLLAGSNADAIAALERALLVAPDRALAWLNLVEALAASKASDAAIDGALAAAIRFSSDRSRVTGVVETRIKEATDPDEKERLGTALGRVKAR